MMTFICAYVTTSLPKDSKINSQQSLIKQISQQDSWKNLSASYAKEKKVWKGKGRLEKEDPKAVSQFHLCSWVIGGNTLGKQAA